eukprot:scaffold9864_cov71-Cyclotella_meneghiniana.AAC.6
MESTEPASTWQQSLSNLKQLLVDESSNNKIEKVCVEILESDRSADGNDDARALPEEVKTVVQTIRLRALIQSGKYADVNINDSASNNVLEGAYALYRMKKYEACRKLCSEHIERNGMGSDGSMGIMHIYAQTLYRMGETREADVIYSKIFDAGKMEVDEKEDMISNALANRIANYTPGSLLSRDVKVWIEQVEEIKGLLNSYGNENEEADILQNYDLAYNLATYLLVSSDSRPRSCVLQAKQLLINAEQSALTVLESTKPDAQESDTAKTVQQKQLAEREAMPIRANLAYANLLLGGDDNEKEALRTYLSYVMEGSKKKTAKSPSGMEANVLAAASNNLALLRDGKESVFDVLKRIPTATSCSVSEDGGGAKTWKGSAVVAIPLVGATPQQVRTVLFNKALQLAKMGNVSGCLETLAVLRASLEVSYRVDDEDKEGKASVSPKINGKKKKTARSESNGISVAHQDVPTAKPSSEVEAVAWNARADWVESELRRVISSDGNEPEKIIRTAINTLDSANKGNADDEAAGALSFMKAQLQLQSTLATNRQAKPQPLIDSLETMPSLVKSCPGTIVTVASLQGALSKDGSTSDELMSSLGDNIPARLAMAEFQLEMNRYGDASQLLESILDEEDSATTEQLMSATALLVRSLSYSNPEKAFDYLETLRESEADGQELESMEIPRFAKKAGEAAATSKVRKMIASGGSKKRVGSRGQGNKKNREAILRKRSKQRDAYLNKLESKGIYDPNKIPQTKPDPERWIPKSQRSYNRRGRRGKYNSNIGAQGGGAGAGMEKDAQKLDVAARVAAAKSGAVNGSGKLTTANMQVSSGPARKGKKKR